MTWLHCHPDGFKFLILSLLPRMLRHSLTILLIVILLAPYPSGAQPANIAFKHIGIEQGLSNSTIESIFQDSRGFIWLGTRDGLNRFDGHQFQVFRHQPGDSNSITDNYITSIREDGDGQLWIGTMNGLSRFNPKLNQFKRFRHQDNKAGSLGHNHISAIHIDRRGRLWISSFGGGIYRLDRTLQQFVKIPTLRQANKAAIENFVHTLFEDSHGNLWAGTESGLYKYDESSQEFGQEESIARKEGKYLAIRSIAEDNRGYLLLGTDNNGLLQYHARYRTQDWFVHAPTQPRSISSNLLRAVLVTSAGTIWTGTVNGGLDYYDPIRQQFFNYQYQPEDPASLSQRTVSALCEDRQGNIWIGTHRGGLNLYMPGAQKFRLFRQKPDKNSLSYNDVKAFCEDRQGRIWIGTDGGGLNLFDKKNKSFQHFRNDPFDVSSLGSNEVIGIMEDRAGLLWVGTWGGGLCKLAPDSRQFTRYAGPSYIQTIYEDSKGRFWVATYYDGLWLFDRSSGSFTRVHRSSSGKSVVAGNNILSIAEDRAGNLWFGTDDGGLNRLDAHTGEFSHYFHLEEKKPDLRVLMVDSRGQLWVGQAGLYRFDAATNLFSLFMTEKVWRTVFVKGIVEDNEGFLWVSSSNGVFRLDVASKSYRSFNTVDGLQGQEFEANASLRTRDGEIYFGGVNGFNSFYPNEIGQNEFIPPVYITEFTIENNAIAGGPENKKIKQDISFTETIELSYREATFSFSFAALNFTSAENNQYSYMLENWDRDWIDAGSEKKAAYTNVSPGVYSFRVRASNNDGLWNEAGRQVRIIIHPPFWQTWWFRILVAAALITAGYYFYRFRRRIQLERFEEAKREQLHQMQLQFFTNISHEFRTPLSLILGPVEKLIRENPDAANQHAYQVIQRNANRLLQLINELMEFRKAEAGALKLQVMRGSLRHFVEEIADEFSELATEKNIRFSTKIIAQPQETWFDRQVLEKIIINLLSNSFKYTPDNGEIRLDIFDSFDHFKPSFRNELKLESYPRKGEFLYFRIADNGIGISGDSIAHLFERYYRVSEAHMGSGIGLAFVKTLTQLHRGNIYVYSERDKGTEFIVAIPVGPDQYAAHEKWTIAANPDSDTSDTKPELAALSQTYPLSPTARISDSANLPLILIADDHEELRGFLKESLEGEFHVMESANGRQALNICQEYFPDIVISDIMMPEMDGIEFCRALKGNDDLSHIPFILLTARSSMEARLEGAGSGADHYFAKPVNTELLIFTVRNVLAQKQKLRERYRRDQHAELRELAHTHKDREFMDELLRIIEQHLSSPDMDVDFICAQVGMSRTKLYHKVKNITGQSIGDFIRSHRLRHAARLMTETELSLTDIMYNVGIQTQSYFSKAFKQEFGKTPTQFLKELETGRMGRESGQ